VRTTKPISTISYNTAPYLEQKLNELQKAKKISLWHFIQHQGEDDEAGKKDHIHLYIEPSKLIQTDDLKEFFSEYDPTHSSKPLTCLTFRSSKFQDWYLYGEHNKAYLASKNQTRRYAYRYEHFKTSDADELNRQYKEIDLTALTPFMAILDAQANGLTFFEYIKHSGVPLPQLRNAEYAWFLCEQNGTYRYDRQTHTPKEKI